MCKHLFRDTTREYIMVNSRHLQGTIITRVRHLLASGSLKTPPLWYNIVLRFPPPKTSLLSLADEVQDDTMIRKITFPIDDALREFYKIYPQARRDPISLLPDVGRESKTDLFLKEYYKHIEKGITHEEAIKISIESFSTIMDKKKHFGEAEGDESWNTNEKIFNMNSVMDLFSERDKSV